MPGVASTRPGWRVTPGRVASQRGYRVRALSRSADKAAALLGERAGLELVFGDLKQPGGLERLLAGVDAVACCTGTTAFPSKRCATAQLHMLRAGVSECG